MVYKPQVFYNVIATECTSLWVVLKGISVRQLLIERPDRWSGAHFTKGLWAHDPNLVKMPNCFYYTVYSIIRSGYNFAYATTAQLSWHVQNCDQM